LSFIKTIDLSYRKIYYLVTSRIKRGDTMRTKKKISLTIDANLFEAIEKAAEAGNMAKSHLAQEAFILWLKQKTEEAMAKGYVEMAMEDKKFADITFQAQKEILS